jgi:hypothetical protein
LIFPEKTTARESFSGPNKKKEKLGQFSAQREALPFGTECGAISINY